MGQWRSSEYRLRVAEHILEEAKAGLLHDIRAGNATMMTKLKNLHAFILDSLSGCCQLGIDELRLFLNRCLDAEYVAAMFYEMPRYEVRPDTLAFMVECLVLLVKCARAVDEGFSDRFTDAQLIYVDALRRATGHVGLREWANTLFHYVDQEVDRR